jgi:hypothetical protein
MTAQRVTTMAFIVVLASSVGLSQIEGAFARGANEMIVRDAIFQPNVVIRIGETLTPARHLDSRQPTEGA